MTLQLKTGYKYGSERIAEGKQLARLHLYPMHPCQLFLLALCTHPTRIIQALLGHELSALNDSVE